MASTRVPFDDFVAMVATNMSKATKEDVTQVMAGQFIEALALTMTQIFSKTGNQEIELPGLFVIEERNRKGKLPSELGGDSYDAQVLSVRVSGSLKDAIQKKSKKLSGDSLNDEEYEAAIA